jgi:hypothetical protein
MSIKSNIYEGLLKVMLSTVYRHIHINIWYFCESLDEQRYYSEECFQLNWALIEMNHIVLQHRYRPQHIFRLKFSVIGVSTMLFEAEKLLHEMLNFRHHKQCVLLYVSVYFLMTSRLFLSWLSNIIYLLDRVSLIRSFFHCWLMNLCEVDAVNKK